MPCSAAQFILRQPTRQGQLHLQGCVCVCVGGRLCACEYMLIGCAEGRLVQCACVYMRLPQAWAAGRRAADIHACASLGESFWRCVQQAGGGSTGVLTAARWFCVLSCVAAHQPYQAGEGMCAVWRLGRCRGLPPGWHLLGAPAVSAGVACVGTQHEHRSPLCRFTAWCVCV